MKYYYCIIILLFLSTSCGRKTSENNSILDSMNILISENPDSAIHILNLYPIPTKNLYNHNRYQLYLTQAKDKLGMDIKNDLQIIGVFNYFENEQDIYYIGLSAYYCGRVLHSNESYDKAIYYYTMAESYAVRNKDKDFQGIILNSMGELMLDHLLSNNAKVKFSKASELFHQTGNYKNEMKSINYLASTFLLSTQSDSALYYYNKAYSLADTYNDNVERAYAIKDKGIVYYDKGDYKMAINLARSSKKIDSMVVSGKADLLLSNAYLKLNQSDSAQFYANSAISSFKRDNSTDLKFYASIYLLLSEIAESKNEYQNSLNNYKLYLESLESLIDQNEVSAIIDSERKYKLEEANGEITVLLEKQIFRGRMIFILFAIIFIINIVYCWIIIRKNKMLSKAMTDILNLTDSLSEFDKTKETINGHYNQYFNILKRAASLEYFVQDSGNKQGQTLIRKFNEIAYGQANIDWSILYNIINSIQDNHFDRIKEKFPELDETEFRICCLLCSKMSSNEIAIIMQLSVNTIHMKTTYIRKKLGIKKYGNIADFLYSNLF